MEKGILDFFSIYHTVTNQFFLNTLDEITQDDNECKIFWDQSCKDTDRDAE